MEDKIREELSEDQLLNIVGGTENKNEKTDEICPVCKEGYLNKRGSSYVCSACFKLFVRKICSSCKVEKLCEEYTGGRYKCTTCQTIF
ncbi:MAG: hypothetical protein IK139_00015 [Lachnospiraceae bacterium]|nr:hypothetical protein [Lachnospiraceae bacterium]